MAINQNTAVGNEKLWKVLKRLPFREAFEIIRNLEGFQPQKRFYPSGVKRPRQKSAIPLER